MFQKILGHSGSSNFYVEALKHDNLLINNIGELINNFYNFTILRQYYLWNSSAELYLFYYPTCYRCSKEFINTDNLPFVTYKILDKRAQLSKLCACILVYNSPDIYLF